jgi:mannan endo-1,4-beta-mannosidase
MTDSRSFAMIGSTWEGIIVSLSPSFVRASGSQFILDSQPFRVAGANNYYVGFESDSMVEPVFDLAVQMGLNALRTWAFLDCGVAAPGAVPANAKDGVFFQYMNSTTAVPGFNDGPDGLERLDRTIFLAEQKGIRLILPLANYWDDFGGVNQYLQWFGLKGRDQFYRNADVKKAYQNYVEHLLLRVNTRSGRQYRDEPAILAWELVNEPRCVNAAGNPLPDGIDTLLGWVAEMSSFIRRLDTNHLIGVGDEGYFKHNFAFGNSLYNGSFGVDCERLMAIPTIDFGSCHLYADFSPAESPDAFGARWIREHIEAGQRASKPMIIEEYGMKNDSGTAAREAAYEAWLGQVVASKGAGALVWMIASAGADGKPYPDYDHYTVYSVDETPAIWKFARSPSPPDPATSTVATATT